jgi:hypothetical protein
MFEVVSLPVADVTIDNLEVVIWELIHRDAVDGGRFLYKITKRRKTHSSSIGTVPGCHSQDCIV